MNKVTSSYNVWYSAARRLSYDQTLCHSGASSHLHEWTHKEWKRTLRRACLIHKLLRGNRTKADIVPVAYRVLEKPLGKTYHPMVHASIPRGDKYILSVGTKECHRFNIWEASTWKLVFTIKLRNSASSWDMVIDGDHFIAAIHVLPLGEVM